MEMYAPMYFPGSGNREQWVPFCLRLFPLEFSCAILPTFPCTSWYLHHFLIVLILKAYKSQNRMLAAERQCLLNRTALLHPWKLSHLNKICLKTTLVNMPMRKGENFQDSIARWRAISNQWLMCERDQFYSPVGTILLTDRLSQVVNAKLTWTILNKLRRFFVCLYIYATIMIIEAVMNLRGSGGHGRSWKGESKGWKWCK